MSFFKGVKKQKKILNEKEVETLRGGGGWGKIPEPLRFFFT